MRKKRENENIAKMNIEAPEIGHFTKMCDGKIQKGSFLKIPSDYQSEFLEEDVKNGAGIYKKMLDELKEEKCSSRVSILESPTKEDGIRAVEYLAIRHLILDGYDSIPSEEEEDIFVEDLYSDLDFSDEETGYLEQFNQIPIIPMAEASNYMMQNTQCDIGGGIFGMQFAMAQKPMHPWWKDCKNEAVCFVCDGNMGFMGEGMLGDIEWEVLRLFSENRRVYIILTNLSPLDSSIQKTLVEFTANLYHVDKDKECRLNYYEKLLKRIAGTWNFQFEKLLDTRALTKRLVEMDQESPCGEFIKVFRYLDHIGAPKTLKDEDFIAFGIHITAVEKAEEQLDITKTLYGMTDVKKQIEEFINMLEYQKLLREKGIKNAAFHASLLFIGPPGTAKSTIATYLGKECLKRGLLPGNRFISLSGAQLKGMYVGHTAHRVHEIFSENDVIFIDEAYSLAERDAGGGDVYSKEALAQIAIELEEHAGDKIVIFAGYGGRNLSRKDNKMHEFLEENPGISSRIGYTVYFDSYDSDEMVNIVHCLAKQDYLDFSHKFDDRIRAYFEKIRFKADFGNGREARVLLEQCKIQLANRISRKKNPSEKELKRIQQSDLDAAIKNLEFGYLERAGKVTGRIGLV